MYSRLILSVLLAAGLGIAWDQGGFPWLGPTLAILLIPLVLWQGKAWQRFSVAVAYYLVGSHGLPGGAAVFFGPGHLMEGVALWLASSVCLALGWAFAGKPWKAAVVLLFDAVVPPLALFDWMSPLASAGALFPGTGIVGVGLLFLWIVLAARTVGRPLWNWAPLIVLPVALNMTAIALPSHAPKSIAGVDLRLGPSTKSIVQNMARLQDWVAIADQHKQPAVLLLPETLLTWGPGSARYIEAHVPVGQTWLVGAAIPVKPGLYADGIEAVTHAGSKMVAESPFPVPVSMWMPWKKPSLFEKQQEFQAGWFEPAFRMQGVRVWSSICYDQLLPFVWLEASTENPHVILTTTNEWWARGTDIPAVQRASSWAWARLIGAPTVEAENY